MSLNLGHQLNTKYMKLNLLLLTKPRTITWTYCNRCIIPNEGLQFRSVFNLLLLRVPYPKWASAPLPVLSVCFSCFYTGIWDLLFNAGSERLLER